MQELPVTMKYGFPKKKQLKESLIHRRQRRKIT